MAIMVDVANTPGMEIKKPFIHFPDSNADVTLPEGFQRPYKHSFVFYVIFSDQGGDTNQSSPEVTYIHHYSTLTPLELHPYFYTNFSTKLEILIDSAAVVPVA